MHCRFGNRGASGLKGQGKDKSGMKDMDDYAGMRTA
jgi:hypothetical protein